jgi:microcompartment protein CcmL/EutN
MTNFFPIGELIDRLIIARIKTEKLGVITNESKWYESAVKNIDLSSVENEMQDLKQAHLRIWEMESLLKSGLEEQISLEEIGRRAIKIRDYNGQRVIIKNSISKKLGCEVVEIKKDHLSKYEF